MKGLVLLLSAAAAGVAGSAQDAVRSAGAVARVDAAARQLSLATDAGMDLTVLVPEGCAILRVPAGVQDLSRAEKIEPAGVEPILAAPPRDRWEILGEWDLDLNMELP
jgi:hypothetical protein